MSIFKGFRKGSGKEKVDPVPVALPSHFKRGGETMEQRVQRIVQFSLSQAAAENEMDTFEDSLDFDIPDDDSYDPSTPWEADHIFASVQAVDRGAAAPPPDVPVERQAELKQKYFRKKAKKPVQTDLEDAINDKKASVEPSDEA